MPKQTFFNLPAEKRERIDQSIRLEFTEFPFSEVSINRIIKEAGIPRGSFYQYFDDKYDVLHYLIDDYLQWFLQLLKTTADNCHGDLFLFCREMINRMGEMAKVYASRQLFQQLISDSTVISELLKEVNRIIDSAKIPSPSAFFSVIDRSRLTLTEEKDLILLSSTMMDIVKNAIMDYILTEESHLDCIHKHHLEKVDFMQAHFEK